MYIRVKRDRLTIFVQVGASDTVHKIKRSLFDSLVFRDQSDASTPGNEQSDALAIIEYDGKTMYDAVQSADDIALVHCQYTKEEDIPSLQEEKQQQGREQCIQTTLLDSFKTLVDSKVENDDIIYIVLRRKDTGEFEDAGPLLTHQQDSIHDTNPGKTTS